MRDTAFVIKNGHLIEYIGNEAHVRIPDTVTAIDDLVFAKNKTIQSVMMLSTVSKLGRAVFGGCERLTTVILSDSLTEIEALTFDHCINLTEVTIPKKVQTIKRLAFYHCEKLADIVLSDHITNICANAFDGCTSLVRMELPHSVEQIGDRAFAHCTNLREVLISGELSYIGCEIFHDISSHMRVTYCGSSEALLNVIFGVERKPTPWITVGRVVPHTPIVRREHQLIYESKRPFYIEVICKKDGKSLIFRSNKE